MMTSLITNWPTNVKAGRGRLAAGLAFTLIELMLVMALLLIALGIVYPSLSRFFRGQHIDSEARRFLALTRYAQSQAISSGIPTQIWIDAPNASYGLQNFPGYLDTDSANPAYVLDQNLSIELASGAGYFAGAAANSPYGNSMNALALGDSSVGGLGGAGPGSSMVNAQPSIGFRPDGSLVESSPGQIILRDRETEEEVWIVRNPIRLTYEIIRPPTR